MYLSSLKLISVTLGLLATACLEGVTPSVLSSRSSFSSLGHIAFFAPSKIVITKPKCPLSRPKTLPFTLSSIDSTAILDYGYEVGGYPRIEVEEVDGPVQLELKYSESRHALGFPFADGPYAYANGLTNTFRVETFNVSKPGLVESYFSQGGQRWQSIRLLTPGKIKFSNVGLRATSPTGDVTKLPGKFESSNDGYNEIWALGARAAATACIDMEVQKPTWDLTPEGALIHGQKPGYSALGGSFTNYTLSFDTKIIRGGTGWSVAGNIQLLLVSELPPESTFVNTNHTLTPPNSLVMAVGYTFVNQTTLPTFYLGSEKVAFTIHEGEWYNIKTTITGPNHLAVWVNNTQILDTNLPAYAQSAASGSFGFAPYQDQIALYTNAVVTAQNGTQIYSNWLTSEDTLGEYGVGYGTNSVCLDGPKRDREVWLGDFFHTAHIIGISTGRFDHITGTLEFCLDRQTLNGILPINGIMGRPPKFLSRAASSRVGLADYQTLGLLALITYYQDTGDLNFPRKHWDQWKLQIEWLMSNIDPSTHLITFSGFLGPANGAAISASLAQALSGAATIAVELDDPIATLYKDTAALIREGINAHLWNEELGVYSEGTSSPSDFSISGVAFAITSGAASTQQALSSLAKIDETLRLQIGYMDNSGVNPNSSATTLSPNTNGFLLSALGDTKTFAPAKYLLDGLWTAMYADPEYSSGASWEYVFPNGEPGLSLFTSESHPWGGAATYFLTNYVAGIRSAEAGYKKFVIDPAYDGFDLDWAKATVPTKYGELSVSWKVEGMRVTVNTDVPRGTSGELIAPDGRRISVRSGKSTFTSVTDKQ